jgi:hypothetical protein
LYKLILLPGINIHLIFHANKLRKNNNNLLLGQTNKQGELILVNNIEEFEIKKVLGIRYIGQ